MDTYSLWFGNVRVLQNSNQTIAKLFSRESNWDLSAKLRHIDLQGGAPTLKCFVYNPHDLLYTIITYNDNANQPDQKKQILTGEHK